jgi:methionyl-tRNA formyltransferase
MKNKKKSDTRFAFFGTSRIAVGILDELEKTGLTPTLVVATPDAPKGRGMKLAAPPTKVWAVSRDIPTFQPTKLDSESISQLEARSSQLFVVVDYGKILPKAVLDIPERGCLNVHFSLLPRYRGASPIRSAILNDDKNIGTSIILLVEALDAGPIVAQKPVTPRTWPTKASELENLLIEESGRLLAQILPEWVAGAIEAREQNHDIATYCEKIEKEDGLLDLSANAYQNLLKVRAYEGWPGTYTFFERNGKKLRVQILDVHLEGDALIIDRIKPEGKKEMDYDEFLRSGAKPLNI